MRPCPCGVKKTPLLRFDVVDRKKTCLHPMDHSARPPNCVALKFATVHA
jgi:hypothetical protein